MIEKLIRRWRRFFDRRNRRPIRRLPGMVARHIAHVTPPRRAWP